MDGCIGKQSLHHHCTNKLLSLPSMKYLAVILSIYIFALNVAPCTDYDASDDNAKTEISQANGDDHQHQDSDGCSPFCICQCCQISAIYFDAPHLEFNIVYMATQDFFYLNGSEKNITTSLLQPPQV